MKHIVCAFWLSLLSMSAYADSSDCHPEIPTPQSIATTMHRAQQLKQQLDNQPEQVVVIVRQGQNMSSRHLTWSHAGYAMRQPDGTWRVYHNLNTCGTAESSLFIQGLYEFLADDLVSNDIAILRPRIELVTALQSILQSPIKLNLFHSSRYNLIAWPFSGPYQNSNGWLLEVFARANDDHIWSRNDARAWLQQKGYQPSVISVSGIEKIGAPLFTSNVFTDDQPAELLQEGKVGLNSGDSVIHFIANYSRPVPECAHLESEKRVCIFTPKDTKQ